MRRSRPVQSHPDQPAFGSARSGNLQRSVVQQRCIVVAFDAESVVRSVSSRLRHINRQLPVILNRGCVSRIRYDAVRITAFAHDGDGCRAVIDEVPARHGGLVDRTKEINACNMGAFRTQFGIGLGSNVQQSILLVEDCQMFARCQFLAIHNKSNRLVRRRE